MCMYVCVVCLCGGSGVLGMLFTTPIRDSSQPPSLPFQHTTSKIVYTVADKQNKYKLKKAHTQNTARNPFAIHNVDLIYYMRRGRALGILLADPGDPILCT